MGFEVFFTIYNEKNLCVIAVHPHKLENMHRIDTRLGWKWLIIMIN